MQTFILSSNGVEFARINSVELNQKLVKKLARQNGVSIKSINVKTI